MIKIGLTGATGRVGKLISECLDNDVDARLSSVYVRKIVDDCLENVIATNDIDTLLHTSDLVIDFSSKELTKELLIRAINKHQKPIVIGTTGLGIEIMELVTQASNRMPILYSSNMSHGVFVLNKIAGIVSAILPDSDIEICEIHHRYKKDAPSGTALKLAETCANSRKLSMDSVRISNRDGIIGERNKNEIGVMALRGGDIVGRHTVGFYLNGEYIELIHNATSRMTFANGAVIAAKWLYKQYSGLYSIDDVIGV